MSWPWLSSRKIPIDAVPGMECARSWPASQRFGKVAGEPHTLCIQISNSNRVEALKSALREYMIAADISICVICSHVETRSKHFVPLIPKRFIAAKQQANCLGGTTEIGLKVGSRKGGRYLGGNGVKMLNRRHKKSNRLATTMMRAFFRSQG